MRFLKPAVRLSKLSGFFNDKQKQQRRMVPVDQSLVDNGDGDAVGGVAVKTEQTTDGESLMDRVERRRRQNRINQRAFRQRKRNQQVITNALDSSVQGSAVIKRSPVSPASADDSGDSIPVKRKAIVKVGETGKEDDVRSRQSSRCRQLVSPDHLERFAEIIFQRHMSSPPGADQLLTLSKANVFRAFTTIMHMIGMPPSLGWMNDDAISMFSAHGPVIREYDSLPLSLQPTSLQKTIAHHPWLDFFPIPKMRDNLVRAKDGWDDEALCLDIMGFWDSSQGSSDCNLLVWGDPLIPENWEVTEEFLRKWPWVVRGCPEILQSTNNWRRKRGDKLIFRYV